MRPPSRRLSLNGRRARYRETGRGPPVVLVHGLGLSSDFWERHYPIYRDAGLRAVAPDLPGFGGSEGPRSGISVGETVDWLLEFAEAVGLSRPGWLGHSLAAQGTIRLAADHPDRAGALVLASPTGAPARFPTLRQAAGLLRDIAHEPFELVPAVAREYLRTSPGTYFGTWLKAAAETALEPASRVRCPTLIVVGRRDPIVPDSYLHRLADAIPRAMVGYIREGAHGVAFGNAGEFGRMTAEFFRRALGAG